MKELKTREILVTSALPYANGPIHLGHLLEYIQADIWVRFQKQRGNDCTYICADDAHGSAIMLRARKEGISPEYLINQVKLQHHTDLSDFLVNFDNFHSTHSEENKTLVFSIYETLRKSGYISRGMIKQYFDLDEGMFLSDRFIKGSCPVCKSIDQYGDNCDKCGATYSSMDLINPRSEISGKAPVIKESEHYFFKLTKFEKILKEWTQSGVLQDSVLNKINEWMSVGLKDWDISRDSPYFGFEIPDHKGKYLYVWLDAPIGYMASFKNLCKKRSDLNFDKYWSKKSKTELYHFIGKDIINFHVLFWPAILEGAGYRKPTAINVHGHLTVNNQKMSKSRGTFIKARTYLKYLDPEYLRYYYASKLSSRIDDLDLNLDELLHKTNSDLVGKVVNIASRCASFIEKYNSGFLNQMTEKPKILEFFFMKAPIIAAAYEKYEFSVAIREIMKLADYANSWIAEKEPWKLAKREDQMLEVQSICVIGINLFRHLIIFLKPVLPRLAIRSENFLNIEPLLWKDSGTLLSFHQLKKFEPLMLRVNPINIKEMIEYSKNPLFGADI